MGDVTRALGTVSRCSSLAMRYATRSPGVGSLLPMTACLRSPKSLLLLRRIKLTLPSIVNPKMVGGYSLRIVMLVLSAFISLLTTVVSTGRYGTVCDRTVYGLPKYDACYALLLGRDGIFQKDGTEHGFLLPYFGFKTQFTDRQWRNRIDLPKVWRNGRYFLSFAGDCQWPNNNSRFWYRRVYCSLVCKHQPERRISYGQRVVGGHSTKRKKCGRYLPGASSYWRWRCVCWYGNTPLHQVSISRLEC